MSWFDTNGLLGPNQIEGVMQWGDSTAEKATHIHPAALPFVPPSYTRGPPGSFGWTRNTGYPILHTDYNVGTVLLPNWHRAIVWVEDAYALTLHGMQIQLLPPISLTITLPNSTTPNQPADWPPPPGVP